MKNLIIGLIVLSAFSCEQSDIKESNMEQAKVIEMVYWKLKDGISLEQGKKEIIKLNEFIIKQPGFISRKTGTAEDGSFIDIVYWSDLGLAKSASEKAMKNAETTEVFKIIDENEMIFKYFEPFNEIKK